VITVKLTPAEAAALREAVDQVLAGEFGGTARQRALERVQIKLTPAKPAPNPVVTVKCTLCGWILVSSAGTLKCPNCGLVFMP
jgi:hypothetical protein